MSVPASIESIGGKFDRSTSGAPGSSTAFEGGAGLGACVGSAGGKASLPALVSRFRRDQRARNSSSLIRARLPDDAAPAPPDLRDPAFA